MSNPYDPASPAGPPSQGPPPQGPPPQGPPPQGPPYGPRPFGPVSPPPPRGTDPVSVTGLVLSVTVCLSPVGVVLGLVGLSRTRGGQRRGRWAAVTAIVLGVPIAVLGVVFAVLVVQAIGTTVTPESAEAGQCVDLESQGGEISFRETDCDQPHDAEIVHVGEIGSRTVEGSVIAEQICSDAMPAADVAQVQEVAGVRWSIATEEPQDTSPGDTFLCYVEAGSGDLDAPVLD